jgi:aminocarboxymuconate-semialdehyde decarboxylase
MICSPTLATHFISLFIFTLVAMAPMVDVHTHIYPPSYISLLSSRTSTPYIYTPKDPHSNQRLIILPSDDDPSLPQSQRGRPIDPSYSSITEKLAFMSHHRIDTSVISLANPWLDFLPTHSAADTARHINNDINDLCAAHPKRLYAFATLPLSAPVPEIVAEIHRLKGLPYIKGIILGTTGLGSGLDDPSLDPIYSALESTSTLAFIHPHYGLPSEVFGPRAAESGHVLPLALGFPLETTIAFTRMFLSGVFGRFQDLKILLAHAGGAVPFLAGRIESCVRHERVESLKVGGSGNGKGIWDVMRRNVWLDGVIYDKVGLGAAVEAVGKDRVLWGTDHPFFPPVGEEEGSTEWLSVKMNVDAASEGFGNDHEAAEGILGGNAVRLLGLDVETQGQYDG